MGSGLTMIELRSFWINPVASIKVRDMMHILVGITVRRRFHPLRRHLLVVPNNSVWVGRGLVLLANMYDIKMPPARIGWE